MAFDGKRYNAQVLEPAIRAKRDLGYFERYGIAPEETNAAAIEAATKDVKQYWNTIKTNPLFGPLINKCLREEKDVREILLDPERRRNRAAKEREDRNKVEAEQFQALDEEIALVVGDGSITPGERDSLVKRFTARGLDQATILGRIKVPVREGQVDTRFDEGLPSSVRAKLSQRLLEFNEPSLYAFLGVSEDVADAGLQRAYQEKKDEWDRKGADSLKAAAQELLGFVHTHLLGTGGRDKYAQARRFEMLEQLRPSIATAGADGRIAAAVFEMLVRRAERGGVDREGATAIILKLAADARVSVEVSKAAETITCPNCRIGNPVNPRQRKCAQCGTDLYLVCPGCNAEQRADSRACPACGFMLGQVGNARYLLGEAKAALRQGRVEEAEKLAEEAAVLWGGERGEVAATLGEVRAALAERKKMTTDLATALAERRMVAARRLLADVAQQWPGQQVGGRPLGMLTPEVDQAIIAADRASRQGEALLARGEVDDAFNQFSAALLQVRDHPAAREGMRRCPPSPPSALQARGWPGRVTLSWRASSSIGQVTYTVRRNIGSPPISEGDGVAVGAEVAGHAAEDTSPPPGEPLYYGVFSRRNGATSPSGAGAGPVINAADVLDFALKASPGTISGSWKLPSALAEPHVTRSEEGGGPPVTIPLTTPYGFRDAGVVNDRVYVYTVTCRYPSPAPHPPALSQGVSARAAAALPPPPVLDLVVTAGEGGLQLAWRPPQRGSVQVFRFTTLPQAREGEVRSSAASRAWGAPLRSTVPGSASDPAPASGRVHYLPVTILHDDVVIGRAVTFMQLPEVTQLVAEDQGSIVRLRWLWPNEARVAKVLWSYDGPPTPESPTFQLIDRGQYNEWGCRIDGYDGRPLQIAVCTGIGAPGEEIWSAAATPASRCALPGRAVARVRYTVALKRVLSNPFRRFFELAMQAEGGLPLPEMVLVARRGTTAPLDPQDGAVVLRIPAGTVPPVVLTSDLGAIPTPQATFRLFAASGNMAAVEIDHPRPDRLKLRV